MSFSIQEGAIYIFLAFLFFIEKVLMKATRSRRIITGHYRCEEGHGAWADSDEGAEIRVGGKHGGG